MAKRSRLTPEQNANKRIDQWLKRPTRGDEGALGSKTRTLSLNGLGLRVFPPRLRELTNLELLSLESNGLETVPEWIGELTKLRGLALGSNGLETLPSNIGLLRNLQTLLLQFNNLRSLPTSIRRCVDLSALDLTGNPALELPKSLLGRHHAGSILRYYFGSRGQSGAPLKELKLILVGRGKAGKTTLVKQLAREKPNSKEDETHSIAIRMLNFRCSRGTVRARAWDFGGQEILHSTHQFFLSERSLYIVVLEPRTGLAQRDAEYWLKLIETHGTNSPAIVLMNWSHKSPWRVDEVKLRRKFPFVVDFLPTDALRGDGIAKLREAIVQTIERHMPDVWLPFPRRWRTIQAAVGAMEDNFLTYEQYTDLCAKMGETDPQAQSDLAEILNDLGLAIYFGKDPRLHDTRVLNPGWVTGGVYAVIRAPSVAAKHGQLTLKDMPRVLREAETRKVIKRASYPPLTHMFILELMRAFQLCFANEHERGDPGQPPKPTRYLVPELLSEFEPAMVERWDDAPVRLRYRYEVLPPGLVPRFIVQTHELSDGEPHWRNGVVLRHESAKCLVRVETDRQELSVFVLGAKEDTRRFLVAMVRRELQTVNKDLKSEPIEELELTGDNAQWISVKALREVETSDGETQTLAIQPEGTAEVNVPRELNKLTTEESRAIDRNRSNAPAAVRLFVSYAHDDERQLKRLDLMLDVLEQQHGLSSWADKRLIAGDEWDAEIRRRLAQMDIFLFIASASSLVRPYIRDPELRVARQRHALGQIELVSVRLEPCASDDDPFLGKLQRLASKQKSIAESKLKSGAWEAVRQDLLAVIKRVQEKRRRKSQKPKRS